MFLLAVILVDFFILPPADLGGHGGVTVQHSSVAQVEGTVYQIPVTLTVSVTVTYLGSEPGGLGGVAVSALG